MSVAATKTADEIKHKEIARRRRRRRLHCRHWRRAELIIAVV